MQISITVELKDDKGKVATSNLQFSSTTEDTLMTIALRTAFAEMPEMLKNIFEAERHEVTTNNVTQECPLKTPKKKGAATAKKKVGKPAAKKTTTK